MAVSDTCLQPWVLVFLLLMSFTRAYGFSSIRLNEGPSDTEGYINFNDSGVWKAICGEGWDALDAMVTCRQLGFTEGYAMFWQKSRHTHYYDPTERPSFIPTGGTDFACNGIEDDLLSCKFSTDASYCNTLATAACGITKVQFNEALSKMNPYGDSNKFEFAIATSSVTSSGQVLVTSKYNYNQIYPTGGICDMDQRAAMLICEHLGYPNGGKKTKIQSTEGLPMILSKLTCDDYDTYIGSCNEQFTSTGVCPDGIKYNGVQCYTKVRPYVIGALVFAGVSSILILIAGACSIRSIRKDRKIPHTTLVNESDEVIARRSHSEP